MRAAARAAWSIRCDVRRGTPRAAALSPSLGNEVAADLTPRELQQRAAAAIGAGRLVAPLERDAIATLQRGGRAAPLGAPWRVRRTFAVPVLLDLVEQELSASSLETLLTCGHRFYTERVLRLGALPLARRPELDAATRGTIGHRVLERLGAGLHQAGAADVTAALEAVSARYPWARDERHKLDLLGLERLLTSFVPAYQALARATDLQSSAPEREFGSDVGVPVELALDGAQPGLAATLGADRIRLRGQIDRIDRVVVGGVAASHVIDLKLGDVSRFRRLRQLGLGLQAAIYAHAMTALGEAKPAAMTYLSVAKGRGEALVSGPAARAALPATVRTDPAESLAAFHDQAVAGITRALVRLVGDSRQGGVGDVAPHSAAERKSLARAGARSCEYCSSQLLCRFASEGAEAA